MARVTELIFKANNRSTIRAFEEISTGAKDSSRNVKRASEESSGSFKKMGESAGRVRTSVMGLAGIVGFGGLAFGIKDVVSAGMQWQSQTAQLRGALKSTGQAAAGTYKDLTDAAERLSTHGGFSEGENVQALTRFVGVTKSASRATYDMSLATNIARRTGKSYSTVIQALMMAESGRTTGLARLGVSVPKVTTAEDRLTAARNKASMALKQYEASGGKLTAAQRAQYELQTRITPQMEKQAKAQDQQASKAGIFAVLQQRYAGATGQFSKTTQGRLANMRNAWEGLEKSIGVGFLPIVNKVVSVAAVMFRWLDRNRVVLYGLLGATVAVTGVLTTHAIITEVVKAKTYALAAAQRLLGLSAEGAAAGEEGATVATIGLSGALTAVPVMALIAGLIYMATHFRQTKAAALELWHGIESGAVTAWHFIETVASKLYNALTWPFRKGWQLIKGIWGKITGLPGAIAHAGGSLLHTATFGLLHSGGVVRPRYMAMGGPVGSDTVPGWLTPGEGVVTRQGMNVLGPQGLAQLNAGRGIAPVVNVTITPMPVNFDGRTVAQVVLKATQNRGARGASTLTGGGLMTGTA